MRNTPYLSGVALAVLVLASAPSSAQLLNLGGSGGGSSGGGDLLNLGGSGDADANVSINLGQIDLDGDGVLDGSLIDIDGDGHGDLLDLDGDGVGDQEVHVRLFGVGENGETQLAIGRDGHDEVIVNLFGAKGQGGTATANILPGGQGNLVSNDQAEATVSLGDSDVIVDLFGRGSGGGSVGGSGEAAVVVDLFGAGNDGDDGAGGRVSGGDDPTQTGSIRGGDTGADGGYGSESNAAASGRAAAAGTARIRANASCFSPTDEQIAHLLSRNSYSSGVASSWQRASKVSLVSIELCPEARARLAAALEASASIDVMQRAVATSPLITAELAPRYQADDVLAVDQSGEQLTVYVY
jgi:hypothetical protein